MSDLIKETLGNSVDAAHAEFADWTTEATALSTRRRLKVLKGLVDFFRCDPEDFPGLEMYGPFD